MRFEIRPSENKRYHFVAIAGNGKEIIKSKDYVRKLNMNKALRTLDGERKCPVVDTTIKPKELNKKTKNGNSIREEGNQNSQLSLHYK